MVSPLDRKLSRDLWRMKGQAMAIGLVISLGVMLLVMMDGLVNTLQQTRDAYYERYRLAEVFVPVKRAPNTLLTVIKALPNVTVVEGRITGDALIDMADLEVPVRAKAISLPDFSQPRLNQLSLTKGRFLDSRQPNEIIILNSFALARNLALNDTLDMTMNGKRWRFTIVGMAQSPEFLYTTAPGELVPDDARYAVFWISNTALEAAYDMKGAFNEALLSISDIYQLPAVLKAVDQLVERYGGIGAYGLEDLVSNRFVSEEISGLEASATGVPPIFMGVAAFLLYIVVSRLVQAEREQIGLLKAFGYGGAEISIHYLKLVLVIACGGAIVGSIFGILAGKSLAVFYQNYFKFPFIIFQINPKAFVTGFMVSIVTASLGSLFVLRQVFALTPAEAMRPVAPADYSSSGALFKRVNSWFEQPIRMVFRRLIRQPLRMLGAVLGIATGMGLSVGMITILIGFDNTIDLSFSVLDRSDANVYFTHAVNKKTVNEIKVIPGVIHVEPFRSVSVIFENGRTSYRGSINGLIAEPRLYRALDADYKPISLASKGIVIAQSLSDILNVTAGDMLTVSVREGRRPQLEIPVIGVSKSLLGAPTYMDIDWLNRYLDEPDRISGVYLTIDPVYSAQIYQTIKEIPAVIGMTLKQDSQTAFAKLMDTGAGAMRYIMAVIAGVITFGIVYNSARIAFAERERDLASLRVIGFTKGETAFVLLGELAIVTLAALPVGSVIGYYLSRLIAQGYSTDIYQIPAIFSVESYAIASIAVLLAACISGYLIKFDIDRVDLVAALKSKQ